MSIWGIILGMAVYMVIGLLWFSKKGIFYGMIKTEKPTGKKYAGDLLNAFLVSTGLSYAFGQISTGGFFTGFAMGLTFGLFFVIPPIFTQVLWMKMPVKYFWIQASHLLVSMALIGGLLMVV